MLVAAVDCCCWSLLLIAAAGYCCWSLLMVAAADCCCWLLLLIAAAVRCCWLLLLVAAANCCCWPESLCIFPGYWWFAAKTILQTKKVFEYFRVVDGKSSNISRILMGGRWKGVSPRGSRVVDGSKRVKIMAVHWVFILVWSRAEREPTGSFSEKLGASRSALQNLRLRQVLKLS